MGSANKMLMWQARFIGWTGHGKDGEENEGAQVRQRYQGRKKRAHVSRCNGGAYLLPHRQKWLVHSSQPRVILLREFCDYHANLESMLGYFQHLFIEHTINT